MNAEEARALTNKYDPLSEKLEHIYQNIKSYASVGNFSMTMEIPGKSIRTLIKEALESNGYRVTCLYDRFGGDPGIMTIG